MKKFKTGFTLMELLLCLGIIGVITSMGMTITKRSADKAYKLYYYNAFTSLNQICNDAYLNGRDNNIDNLRNHVNDYLGASGTDGTINKITTTSPIIHANNGVTYQFRANGNPASKDKAPYLIGMTVPTKKTSRGTSEVLTFCYYIDKDIANAPYLIQVNGNTDISRDVNILPSYIDDGVVGRVTSSGYTPIVYDTYHNNLCLKFGNINITNPANANSIILDCSGATASQTGRIKFSDPRNVKYHK